MRADKFFSETFGSRTKAAEAIARGRILVNGVPARASTEIKGDEHIDILPAESLFVSNGGYKLERAIQAFGLNAEGKVFADLGASTGGFTDCLLQCGAKKVYCVDVGESQLDARLASDARVCVMDRTNARYLTAADFPERIDGLVSDLSFISLTLVFPAIAAVLPEGGRAVVLIKPQFEAGRGKIGKGGIVPVREHGAVLSSLYDAACLCGLAPLGIVNAPLRERKNVEYAALLGKGAVPTEKAAFVRYPYR